MYHILYRRVAMKRILTFGVYDYFHIGHLRLFKQCKEYGDYLIVAVQDGNIVQEYKPNSKTFYSTNERVEILEELRMVDKVIVYDHVTPKTLSQIDFDILALGEDHVGKRFDIVIKWCRKNNKDVVRLKRTPGISSTDIKLSKIQAD